MSTVFPQGTTRIPLASIKQVTSDSRSAALTVTGIGSYPLAGADMFWIRSTHIMPGPKILIVDDEQVFAETLAQIFQKEGYDCRAVYSAEQAVEMIASWEPALTIVDVMLPGMNGIDFAISLKQSHPSIAIMMISGQLATSGLVEAAAQRGHVFSILPKPFPVPDLLSNASKILGHITQSQETTPNRLN